jgi:tyrosyl-tRNA synthetase
MRKIESVETIQANALRIRDQIGRFMNFDGRNALLVDNADWLANLNYIEFLRDIGRHFSVNRMLSFETYKMRLETGLSFIEFNYQLLQSYDYLILNQQQGCELQIGGDDQWGNIVAGVDLVRRVEGNEVFGLTFPLVTRADGKKMGKTEKGALYLDPAMTSPYDFYQYWRNVPDADVEKFLLLYTFLPVQEIKEIGKRQGKELNEGKSRLAFELTRIVHGEEEATKARTAAEAVFGGTGDAAALPSMELTRAELDAGINVVELFARTSLCNTKSEARRLVQQGGAIVNDTKVSDIDGTVDTSWLSDGQLLLRAGKKRYFRVVLTS